jgi:site-specific recombinase XerD
LGAGQQGDLNVSMKRTHIKNRYYLVISILYSNKDYGYFKSSSHTGRHSMARLAQKLLKRKDLNTDVIVPNLLHHRSIESQSDYTDVDFNHIRECTRNMFPQPKKRGPKPKSNNKETK